MMLVTNVGTRSTCMSDSGVGLFVNKMMINNTISKWYSHSVAAFQTRESEMFNGSELQKKGKCIQSKKYPLIGITVDYYIKKIVLQVQFTGRMLEDA